MAPRPGGSSTQAAGRHGPVADRVQPRLKRAELRQLLLDSARELVKAEGVETSVTNLTFGRVFDHVAERTGRRLSNGSVIGRIWDSLAEFQADVLVALAHDPERLEIEQTVQAIATVLGEADLSTTESRRVALRELCRVGGNASSRAVAVSATWSLWINMLAIATTTSDAYQREHLGDAAVESYRSMTDLWEENYGALMGFLGLRVRAPRTIRQFTAVVAGLTDGLALRHHVEGAVQAFDLPTGPGGADQEWTLFASGLEALVDQFFEPDPDFVPPA